MEIILISFLALALIMLILLVPASARRQATIEHEQTLAAMVDASNEAKQQIRDLHRTYRAELTRVARERATPPRRTR
ncbi:MAG: hypothetical protein JNM64_18680 [Chloroflexia bacterium]|nr:hypothetical protein [Chloroflexia bacterium]